MCLSLKAQYICFWSCDVSLEACGVLCRSAYDRKHIKGAARRLGIWGKTCQIYAAVFDVF